MRRFFVLLLWRAGVKGNKCRCSFHEAAHYRPDFEWDVDDYPCGRFQPITPTGDAE